MKRTFKLALGVSLLTPLLAFGSVFAIAREDGGAVRPSTTDGPQVLQAQNEVPGAEERPGVDPSKLKERIDKRKADLKTRLSAAEQTRLKARCKASQSKISLLEGRLKGLETSRSQVYENLVARLTSLNEKLNAQSVDTTDLTGGVTTLKTKIEAFKTDLATYEQAVVDLAAMDCAADPIGFQASLTAARAARAAAVQDSTDIKTHLTDTIKSALNTIKSQLNGESVQTIEEENQ